MFDQVQFQFFFCLPWRRKDGRSQPGQVLDGLPAVYFFSKALLALGGFPANHEGFPRGSPGIPA